MESHIKYVGLTDDPEASRKAHGKPGDWFQCSFKNEKKALEWLKDELDRPNHIGDVKGEGWKFGYSYTITNTTTQ